MSEYSDYAVKFAVPEIPVVLDEGAYMPVRAHEPDAGADLFSPCSVTVYPGESAVIDTGVHMAIPYGYAGFIKSKSGLNVKHGILSEGVVDAGYTGSIRAVLFNHSHRFVRIRWHQKITQLVILPIITPELELVDGLEDTERGNGGFGSTGRF
jgi:dUTP pyrophosphatase